MKTVPVEYIDSGTFQGGEEDVSKAGIKHGEECVVVKKKVLSQLQKQLKAAKSIMWMAEKYAEAGGSRSVEMEDYNTVAELLGLNETKGGN